MYEIADTARSMRFEFDGIEARFQMPENRSDQAMLAAGRGFHSAARNDYENAFVKYGLPAAFLDELKSAIDAFDAALSPPVTPTDAHVAATSDIGTVVRRGMQARQILLGVVKNKYRSDTGKLAAWVSASHIERPPKGDDEDEG